MDIVKARRIVTATNPRGKSYVLSDQRLGPSFHQPYRPVAMTDLWMVSSVPSSTCDDPNLGPFRLSPPNSGVTTRIVQFDPVDASDATPVDGASVFADMGATGAHVRNAAHPYMHRTSSVDVGIILTGAITMILDEGEVELSQGDTVIQRGTAHAWENRTDEPCMIAFVLIAAEECTRCAGEGVHEEGSFGEVGASS
ncbi:MAG TPA: cupin domain-containing protein [Propionibacteriaceae bacterium]